MRAVSLLSIVGRFPAEAWDAIIPHGPAFRARGDVVALNPQPLPPHDPFLVGAAQMANELVRVAVEAQLREGSSVGWLSEIIEDWCATPWPRRWPWPGPGPRPDEGPLPDPWRIDVGRVIGAVVFASAGSRLADGELRTVLLDGAERLAEVAAPG